MSAFATKGEGSSPLHVRNGIGCDVSMFVNERISTTNSTIYASFANHIQRYKFAEQYCAGCRVLDAGCGIGYGSAHLAMNGAESVVAVDISDEAIAEAKRLYSRDNLRFLKGNVEHLTEIPDLNGPFDVAINFENIEHLTNPERFLAELRQVLKGDATLVVSTPNGQLTEYDREGKIKNPYHVKEFTEDEFREMLGRFFGSIELFGQWKTPEMLARIEFEQRLFDVLCELYYSPHARLWRAIRKILGKPCGPAPAYTGEYTCYERDSTIQRIELPPFVWAPNVFLAVCRP
jgi:2-polyprenyl-3-methyl-5-hydroxy-6-metoxy-1,4-benzoquinol methylase